MKSLAFAADAGGAYLSLWFSMAVSPFDRPRVPKRIVESWCTAQRGPLSLKRESCSSENSRPRARDSVRRASDFVQSPLHQLHPDRGSECLIRHARHLPDAPRCPRQTAEAGLFFEAMTYVKLLLAGSLPYSSRICSMFITVFRERVRAKRRLADSSSGSSKAFDHLFSGC